MQRIQSIRREAGFTIVEVLVALTLIACSAIGVAQLFHVAVASTRAARHQTSTSTLAVQKLEQLRALRWVWASETGLPDQDASTDLSTDPATDTGVGLTPSPAGTLAANVPGYVDYLDARGSWVGTGAIPPGPAMYIRRWSIDPLPADPGNTLLLQVLVTTIRRASQAAPGPGERTRLADEALVATVTTRRVGWS
jgi:prepilin-type N-terminal cleavage/methylation domain-containing protein